MKWNLLKAYDKLWPLANVKQYTCGKDQDITQQFRKRKQNGARGGVKRKF